jgi:multiple sugar transport system permease protein
MSNDPDRTGPSPAVPAVPDTVLSSSRWSPVGGPATTSSTPHGQVRARRRRSSTAKWRRRRGALLVAPALILIALIFVLPLCVSVYMSLSSWPLLGSHHFQGFANYTRLFQDPQIRQALLFTFEFAVIITPVVFFGGLLLASLVQHERPGVGIIRTAIFAPVAVGFASASYLWLALTDPSTGIFDRFLVDIGATGHTVDWLLRPSLALLLVAIVTVWKIAGFAMIALMNGLQAVPSEVEEAARVDGVGRIRMMWGIKLPLMKESIAFTLTFVAIGSFLTFDQFYILTGGGPNNHTITAVYRIYNVAFTQTDLGYAAAISMVFLLLLLLVTSTQLYLLRRGSDS